MLLRAADTMPLLPCFSRHAACRHFRYAAPLCCCCLILSLLRFFAALPPPRHYHAADIFAIYGYNRHTRRHWHICCHYYAAPLMLICHIFCLMLLLLLYAADACAIIPPLPICWFALPQTRVYAPCRAADTSRHATPCCFFYFAIRH